MWRDRRRSQTAATVRNLLLVAHSINHRVEAETVSIARQLLRIARKIHILPRVPEIGIVRNNDLQAAALVRDSVDARFSVVRLFPIRRPRAAITSIRNLQDLVDIEEGVEDFMLQ